MKGLKNKSNNKGFSLVELIIVIAIMAVLGGVIVLAVLPRVEQARKQTDATTMQTWRESAVEAAAYAGQDNVTFTIASNTVTTSPEGIKDKFLELANLEAAGYDFTKFSSSEGKKITSVIITISEANPQGVISYVGTEAFDTTAFDGNGNPT